jgi:SAM-dependent methyltransferase
MQPQSVIAKNDPAIRSTPCGLRSLNTVPTVRDTIGFFYSLVRHRMAPTFSGSGPGIQTPDGCSVSLYRLMPYMDELRDIEHALQMHSTALELGCGTGRLCARLLELGLSVTGVDESDEMLAHLPKNVERIQSSIEQLNLGRRWSAVLLPSHLINHPDASTRGEFVAAARRHVSSAGAFYAKRHNPSWLTTVQAGSIGHSSGVTYYVEQVARTGNLIAMTLRYEAYGQSWTQSFSTVSLSEVEIEDLLQQHGFGRIEWLGRERLWVSAFAPDA